MRKKLYIRYICFLTYMILYKNTILDIPTYYNGLSFKIYKLNLCR